MNPPLHELDQLQARATLLRQIELTVDAELPYVASHDRANLIWKLADKVCTAFPEPK